MDEVPTIATVQQPTHVAVKDSTWTLNDAYFIAIFAVAIVVVLGFFMNNQRVKRKEDQEDAQTRTKLIMDEIKNSHNDSARDVRELSDKVKDGRTVLEKDIEAIRAVVRHDIGNVKTSIQAVQHYGEKNADEIMKLRDRMTAQETDSKHQNAALDKLEVTVREKIDEMKDLIKAQGETTTTQFKELSNSIREARDARFKP